MVSISKPLKERFAYIASSFEVVTGLPSVEFVPNYVGYLNGTCDFEVAVEFMRRADIYFKSKGLTPEVIMHNKDLFMPASVKKKEGSFFTPLRWARKAHELVMAGVSSVGQDLSDYVVWDCASGVGNLLLEFPRCKHLYFSTLNSEDIPVVEERVSKRLDKQPFTAFQLDFLGSVDSGFVPSLTNQLPKGLQEVLKNKGKLAIIINPPYSVKGVKTGLFNHLKQIGQPEFGVDLYLQFVWQVMHLVEYWGLTDVEFVLMTTYSMHIMDTGEPAVKQLCSTFNYGGGFLFPASDFDGVNKDFVWGISTTRWFKHEGVPHVETTFMDLDVLQSSETSKVEVKGVTGELRSEPELEKVRTTSYSVEMPLRFAKVLGLLAKSKKDKVFPRVSIYGDRLVDNQLLKLESRTPLFYMQVRDSLRSSPAYLSVSSVGGVDVCSVAIYEENFWSAVYFFLATMEDRSWVNGAYERLLSPAFDDYYETVWKPNALLMFLSARKQMTSAVRDLPSQVGSVSLNNGLWFISKAETLEAISKNRDEFSRKSLMHDVERFSLSDGFIVAEVEKALASPNVLPSVKELFLTTKGIYLKYLECRDVIEGQPLTSAYDLGLVQIRRLSNFVSSDLEPYLDFSRNIGFGERLQLLHGLSFNRRSPDVNNRAW